MRSCRAGHLQEPVEVTPLQATSPTGSHHVHPRVCLSWHQGGLSPWWSQLWLCCSEADQPHVQGY